MKESTLLHAIRLSESLKCHIFDQVVSSLKLNGINFDMICMNVNFNIFCITGDSYFECAEERNSVFVSIRP